jgi:16S rRNA C967 or C1407 C5-methylase (RsmB/RsmF family)
VATAAGLMLKPIENESIVKGIAVDPGGWIRVLPANHADGFFIARFVRA